MLELNGMQSNNLCLQWQNVNFFVPDQSDFNFLELCQKKKKLHILKNVNGQLKSGNLIGILGSSGAGKTTLLAAISQRLRGNLCGSINLNGYALRRKQMIRISGFLPQFEINVQTFTAFEHLYFMCHFKMDRKTTKLEKEQRVNELLVTVGLSEVAHTRIPHLSGGERKRLSLAEELITNPPFLFCDEPTTGLDSYNAYTVIKTLRHLCTQRRLKNYSLSMLYGDDIFSEPTRKSYQIIINESGAKMLTKYTDNKPDSDFMTSLLYNSPKKAAICSIHQPTSDIFELFTHIIIMDSGRIIYQGSSQNALKFFSEIGYRIPSKCNPADFYLKTINDCQEPEMEKLIAKYELETSGLYTNCWLKDRKKFDNCLELQNDIQRVNWLNQVYFLLLRLLKDDFYSARNHFISMFIFTTTCITIATMYSDIDLLQQSSVQNIAGAFFTFTSEIILTISYSVTATFPAVLPLLRREVGEGTYSISAYYVAAVLALIFPWFLKCYFFFAIFYFPLFASRGFALYLSMGFIVSLSGIAAVAYGLFLSSLFESDKMAYDCAAPLDLLFLIFSGAYINVDAIPLLKYISVFYYTNEALMYKFWLPVDYIECPANSAHPCFQNGLEVLQNSSFCTGTETFIVDCIGLVAVAFVFHISTYFLIRRYVVRCGFY